MITAEFRRDYAAALRNKHLNESEIARQSDKIVTTEGLAPDVLAEAHFERIVLERNARVREKARATVRRMVCGVCMVGPISAFLAGAMLYVAA